MPRKKISPRKKSPARKKKVSKKKSSRKRGVKTRKGQRRGIIGGWYPVDHKWRMKKKRRGNASNLICLPTTICKKCGRTIFGGAKGLRTHNRNQH